MPIGPIGGARRAPFPDETCSNAKAPLCVAPISSRLRISTNPDPRYHGLQNHHCQQGHFCYTRHDLPRITEAPPPYSQVVGSSSASTSLGSTSSSARRGPQRRSASASWPTLPSRAAQQSSRGSFLSSSSRRSSSSGAANGSFNTVISLAALLDSAVGIVCSRCRKKGNKLCKGGWCKTCCDNTECTRHAGAPLPPPAATSSPLSIRSDASIGTQYVSTSSSSPLGRVEIMSSQSSALPGSSSYVPSSQASSTSSVSRLSVPALLVGRDATFYVYQDCTSPPWRLVLQLPTHQFSLSQLRGFAEDARLVLPRGLEAVLRNPRGKWERYHCGYDEWQQTSWLAPQTVWAGAVFLIRRHQRGGPPYDRPLHSWDGVYLAAVDAWEHRPVQDLPDLFADEATAQSNVAGPSRKREVIVISSDDEAPQPPPRKRFKQEDPRYPTEPKIMVKGQGSRAIPLELLDSDMDEDGDQVGDDEGPNETDDSDIDVISVEMRAT